MSNFLKNLHPLLRRGKNKYDNQDPNYALIKVLNEEMNKVEQDAIKSKLQSSLKTATGSYLNKFGDWFGLYRKPNESDDNYRARIIEYLLLKRGTNNSIIKAIKDYLEKSDAYVSVYEPYKNIFYTNKSHLNGEDHLMGYYYRFAIINITIGSYFPVEILDVINKFKPAGVKVYVTYDGSYTHNGSPVVDILGDFPKITNYHYFTRLSGFGDTYYGHINLSERKENYEGSSTVFRTNKSNINSTDVLSGSSTVGRDHYNYAYYSTHAYTLADNSPATSRDVYSAVEMPIEYYIYTKELDTYIAEYNLPKTSSVKYIHNNFNLEEYFLKYRPEVIKSKSKSNIVDFMGTVNYDYYMSAVIPPDDYITVDLQIFDFSTKTWNTIKTTKVSNKEVNVGGSIGYLTDYINSRFCIFTRLSIRDYKEVTIKVNYVDILFTKELPNEYSNNSVLDNTYYLGSTVYNFNFVDLYKVSLPTNEDIISKRAYYPSQFIRISDNYDNTINRNLLSNTVISKGTYSSPSNSTTTKKESSILVSSSSSSNGTNIKLNSNILLVNDKQYTLTFTQKSSDNSKYDNTYFVDSKGATVSLPIEDTITENSSSKISKTFTFSGESGYYDLVIGKSSNTTFELSNFKLEKGAEETPFQPNPKDVYTSQPNNSLTLELFTSDSTPIQSTTYENKNTNLLQATKNDNEISSMVIDTEYFIAEGYATTLYSASYLSKVLEEGKQYTLHIDMEVKELADSSLVVADKSHGLWFYSATDTKNNVNAVSKIDAVKGTKITKTVTFTAPKITDHRILIYTGRYTADGTLYAQPIKFNKVAVTNLTLQEGTEYTGYVKSSKDTINFLDRTVKVTGARTDIGSVKVTSGYDFGSVNLMYSTYGTSFDKIKGATVNTGTSTITNKYIDLYGVGIIDYSDINPLSDVILQSIWDIPIDTLTSKTGQVNELYPGFFNTVWQEIYPTQPEVYKVTSLNILKDSHNGVFDNSTGEVVSMSSSKVTNYTTITTYSERQIVYNEPIVMDSNILMDNTTYTLDTETYEKDTTYLKNIL